MPNTHQETVDTLNQQYHEKHFNTDNENAFTIYWKGGTRNIVKGIDIADAFHKGGYGGGAINAVDWYDNGITYTHDYNKETKQWDKLETPYLDFTVYWPDGKKEHLAGTDIKQALKRAGREDFELVTMHVWEDGIVDNYLYFPMEQKWIARDQLTNIFK